MVDWSGYTGTVIVAASFPAGFLAKVSATFVDSPFARLCLAHSLCFETSEVAGNPRQTVDLPSQDKMEDD